MRLFVFLMIPVLVSCLVEERDPEASDAKGAFSPPPKDNAGHKWTGDEWAGDYVVGKLLVITSEDNNHSQIVHVMMNLDKDIGLIQALDWDKNGELMPQKVAKTDAGCADRYHKLKPRNPNAPVSGSVTSRTWEKNGKTLFIRVRGVMNRYISDVSYTVLDEHGNEVLYKFDKNRSSDLAHKMNQYDVERLREAALKADDCIEGSPSGEPTDKPLGG